MAGITQKNSVALFLLWPLKKTFFGGRANENQQKQRKIQSFDKKSCQYDDNCNNNCYFSDNKDKKQQQ